MTDRAQAFLKFADHPMLGKDFRKLSKVDVDTCLQFIVDHSRLDKNQFGEKVNRWMLDQVRPKNYSLMWSLVLQANGAAK